MKAEDVPPQLGGANVYSGLDEAMMDICADYDDISDDGFLE
jgi:hypothetical protein